MSKQTLRYAKSRLARFETVRVYSYSVVKGARRRPTARTGVYGKGK